MNSVRSIARALKPVVYSNSLSKVNAFVEQASLRAYWRSRYWRWYFSNRTKLLTYEDGRLDAAFRYRMYQKLLVEEDLETEPVDYLEFGVAAGDSIRWWSNTLKSPEARLVGFDLFTGLPEAWESLKAGSFSTGGKAPEIADARCSFRRGFVQETLPVFLKSASGSRRKVVHMDLDLYSGTLFTLIHLAPVLQVGDIVIFDEFASYMHEFRAWTDFLGTCSLKFESLYGANDFFQVVFKRTE